MGRRAEEATAVAMRQFTASFPGSSLPPPTVSVPATPPALLAAGAAVVTAADVRNSLKAQLVLCEKRIAALSGHGDDPDMATLLRAKSAEAEGIKFQLHDLKPIKQQLADGLAARDKADRLRSKLRAEIGELQAQFALKSKELTNVDLEFSRLAAAVVSLTEQQAVEARLLASQDAATSAAIASAVVQQHWHIQHVTRAASAGMTRTVGGTTKQHCAQQMSSSSPQLPD